MPGGLSIRLIYQSVIHICFHTVQIKIIMSQKTAVSISYHTSTENKKHEKKNKTENTTYMFNDLTRRYAPKSSPVMLIDSGYPVPRNPWQFEAISDTRIQVLNVAMNQRLAGGGTVNGTVLSRPLKPEGFHRLTCMIDSSHLRAQAV